MRFKVVVEIEAACEADAQNVRDEIAESLQDADDACCFTGETTWFVGELEETDVAPAGNFCCGENP